jgi:hypothetical protein
MSSPNIIVISERQGERMTRLGRNAEGWFIESWTFARDTVAARIPLSEKALKEIISNADLKKMLGA